MFFSSLLAFFFLILPVIITYFSLLGSLQALRVKEVYKLDKLLIFTVLMVVGNILAGWLLNLIKSPSLLEAIISALITYLIAYFLAKEFLKIEQKKAIYFGVYFVVISYLLSIVLGLVLYTAGVGFFNLNFK